MADVLLGNVFHNSVFENSRVILDANSFTECKFKNCVLTYGGGRPPTLVRCNLVDCRFEFVGTAGTTLSLIAALYHGLGEGGKALVEATFENIRRAPPPNIISDKSADAKIPADAKVVRSSTAANTETDIL